MDPNRDFNFLGSSFLDILSLIVTLPVYLRLIRLNGSLSKSFLWFLKKCVNIKTPACSEEQPLLANECSRILLIPSFSES